MPDSRHQIRQKRLVDELDRLGLDALVLNPGHSLSYMTGLRFHLSERPVVGIFRPEGIPIVVLPELEIGKVRALPYDVRSSTYGENPSTWPRAFAKAAAEAGLDYRRIGVEPRSLRVLELRLLEEVAPRAAYLNGEEAVSALRVKKDEKEIASIREAVRIAQQALTEAVASMRLGMSEIELTREVTLQLHRAGSEPELPFSPIVAFGENAANPHAVPTRRELRGGDLVLIDWGASSDGYFSDLTRVFRIGEVEEELSTIARVVRDANVAAREKAAPGIAAREVDAAARRVIDAAGFGEYFTHRTGHGLGLDGHEEPYIRSDNDQELEPGMVFTVEPGIYLPDRGGVRIEDDVLVTEGSAESLSSMDRDLGPIELPQTAPAR